MRRLTEERGSLLELVLLSAFAPNLVLGIVANGMEVAPVPLMVAHTHSIHL